MSGDAGVVSVETREQLARIHALRHVAHETRFIAAALEVETPPIPSTMLALALLPPDIGGGHHDVAAAIGVLRAAADRADALADSSSTATTRYAENEQLGVRALEVLGSISGAVGGAVIGAGLRTAAVVALPAAGVIGMAALANPVGAITAALLVKREAPAAAAAVQSLLLEHPELISNPVTAGFVRELVSGADEAISAAVGVPVVASVLAGEVGTGRRGTTGSTRQILSALRAGGAYRESDVVTRRALSAPDGSTPAIDSAASPPPGTLAERVQRIPRLETDGGAQVRIERYSRPGSADAFTVYISGTAEWGPSSGTPFDFTSDLSQKAGERSGAYRAVEQAMQQAGVDRSSKVVFVGHSLGGLVAHDLAASGEWNAAGVLEVGSPPSDRPAPESVPDIMIENDSDIVPALGERADDDSVLVRTHPFDTDAVPPTSPGNPVPAHSRDVYAAMAGAADRSDDPQLRDAIAALDSVSDGASVSTTFWLSERVSDGRDPAHG